MINAIELNNSQFKFIDGKEFAPFQLFKCIEINQKKYLCLSEFDKKLIEGTNFEFVLDLNETKIMLPNAPKSAHLS